MLPRLYDASFDTSAYLVRNGYGFFDRCVKNDVTEEENGNYFLEMTIDAADRLAAAVAPNMFIKAMPNFRDPPQLFEINEVSINANGNIDIQAQHIKYLCYQNYLNNRYTDVDEEDTAQAIGTKYFAYAALMNKFSFYSDIPDVKYLETIDAGAKTFGELLGDDEGGLLHTFGGEYHYDNFRIELLKKRGVDTAHKLIFGANLSDFTQTASNDAAYTHIIGTAKVKRSDSPYNKTFSGVPYATGITRVFPKVLRVDLTNELQAIYGSDMKINLSGSSAPEQKNVPADLTVQKIQDSLTALTARYYQQNDLYHKALSVGMTITHEPDLEQMRDIGLCDTLRVIIGGGLTTTAKVTKVVFDSLAERYQSLTIGEPTVSLSNFIKEKRR